MGSSSYADRGALTEELRCVRDSILCTRSDGEGRRSAALPRAWIHAGGRSDLAHCDSARRLRGTSRWQHRNRA